MAWDARFGNGIHLLILCLPFLPPREQGVQWPSIHIPSKYRFLSCLPLLHTYWMESARLPPPQKHIMIWVDIAPGRISMYCMILLVAETGLFFAPAAIHVLVLGVLRIDCQRSLQFIDRAPSKLQTTGGVSVCQISPLRWHSVATHTWTITIR